MNKTERARIKRAQNEIYSVGDIVQETNYPYHVGTITRIKPKSYGNLYVIRKTNKRTVHRRFEEIRFKPKKYPKWQTPVETKPPEFRTFTPLAYCHCDRFSGVLLWTWESKYRGKTCVHGEMLVTHDRYGKTPRKREMRHVIPEGCNAEPFDISHINPDWFRFDMTQRYYKRYSVRFPSP